ncbi:MAG: FmdB family transcriptional regulator, partial [Nitrospinota bacterium]
KTRTCPTCGKRARRILSPAGFILKGAGFYVNDYPSASRKAGLKEEVKKGSEAAKTSEKSSEPPSAKD